MKSWHPIVLFSLAGLLSACSGGTVKETLGIDRKPPDEFRVVTRPPLSVPPEFNLRPPASGADVIQTEAADQKASELILGTPAARDPKTNTFMLKDGEAETAVKPVEIMSKSSSATATTGSTGEAQLLMNAGAQNADPSVRTQLEEEKVQVLQKQEEESWWDIWTTNPAPKDPLVDAKKEKERIKTNQSEGKPVTEGDTPEVKARNRGILGRILGD
ncbi:MAG: DUF3035 domain-containing protein [Rickettsiales bacterium]|nr:DUF3035 domain-containing protein [Rickettsiales bacterium]